MAGFRGRALPSLPGPVLWRERGCPVCGGPTYRSTWEREVTCLHCARTFSLDPPGPTVAEAVGEDVLTRLLQVFASSSGELAVST